MSLLNPNGLPDRQLIKTAVFGALHNAGHWCSSQSESSLSIIKKQGAIERRIPVVSLLSAQVLKEDFNGRICQMFMYCQDNVISILVRHEHMTSHLWRERCWSLFLKHQM